MRRLATWRDRNDGVGLLRASVSPIVLNVFRSKMVTVLDCPLLNNPAQSRTMAILCTPDLSIFPSIAPESTSITSTVFRGEHTGGEQPIDGEIVRVALAGDGISDDPIDVGCPSGCAERLSNKNKMEKVLIGSSEREQSKCRSYLDCSTKTGPIRRAPTDHRSTREREPTMNCSWRGGGRFRCFRWYCCCRDQS